MSVKELMELLSKMDQDKQVLIYNGEWESYDPIDYVNFTDDGDLVLL